MNDINKYCYLIDEYPGGIDYFHYWVKAFHKHFNKRVQIVKSYFKAGGYSEGGLNKHAQFPSKKSENTFIELSKIYLKSSKEEISNRIVKKEKLRLRLLNLYSQVSSIEGGYEKFFKWIKQNPEFEKFSKTFIIRRIIEDKFIKRINSKFYVGMLTDFSDKLEEYLITNKSDFQKITITNIPNDLVTPLQQYFLYFNKFVESIKNDKVDIEILTIKNGLQFKFNSNNEHEINKVKNYLNEYLEIAKKAILNKINPNDFTKNIESDEINKIRFEAQISHLQLNLKLVEAENKYLSQENKFLKELSFKLVENSNVKITNQHISDGNQQFATEIKNLK